MTDDNRPEVQKVLIITLLLNLLVIGLKGFLGYMTGSLSLFADALHSVTDAANNVLGLIASKYSAPEPDIEHPYGHQKFEAVGALGIAAFLAIACWQILQGAVERIIQGSEPVNISPVELWLLLIVLGINIFVAFYERRVGKRVGSPILVADAAHTMSDVWVTITVIGGLIGVWLGDQWLDVVLAFPVALLVFWTGFSVVKTNLPWLVDQMAIAPETIYAIATAVPGVINCHKIASRGVLGRQVFIEMHLIVDAPDVETAHHITEEVERRLEQRFSPVRILIHIEPPTYKSEQISF
ncbi:cation transporter [Nodularia spumigena CENA596]|uniref:Cation transporter n=1 Tax=Nodularia spumigena CENA596 TaxID=1819295 RepID=A0A166I9I9_NODSP|nr:cation diffusion facilitator family transporter [Nodularia spumigena]KZL48104.1 cation transporter [Nodularia spumigena CENA596]